MHSGLHFLDTNPCGEKKKKKASKKSVPVSVRVMPGTEGSELRVQAPFSI